MTHPDAVIAMLAGSSAVDAHFTSPPFAQREKKDPRVRTIMVSDDVMGGSTTFTMVSTTTKFREQNPKVYAAVLKAIDEANRMIAADKKNGGRASAGITAMTRVFRSRKSWTSSAIRISSSRQRPENVMKYADFMHAIGSIRNRPASWKDMFFPEIHGAPGS